MNNTLNYMTLSGPENSTVARIENKLLEFLSILELPIELKSKKEHSEIQLTYRNSVIIFSKEGQDEDFKSLFEFLNKINPKTGKICKCINCGKCSSKK